MKKIVFALFAIGVVLNGFACHSCSHFTWCSCFECRTIQKYDKSVWIKCRSCGSKISVRVMHVYCRTRNKYVPVERPYPFCKKCSGR